MILLNLPYLKQIDSRHRLDRGIMRLLLIHWKSLSSVLGSIIRRWVWGRSISRSRIILRIISVVVCLRVSTGGGSRTGMRDNKG